MEYLDLKEYLTELKRDIKQFTEELKETKQEVSPAEETEKTSNI